MKRIIALIFVFLSFVACKKEYQSRNITNISIKEFTVNDVSIRAIIALDKDKVAYAGSNGNIGLFNAVENTSKIIPIKYQDTISPNFRSIASNNRGLFVLSIVNPALLYKISEGKTVLVYKEEHEKVFYDSMHFFDDNLHGIAVGDPTEDCPSIIVTNDAGETWNKLSCDVLPKFEEDEAFFAASNTNIKTIGSTVWIASGGKKARILKSTDYGETWEIFNTPIVQGNGPQGIYSIDFNDKNNGIIVGGNYEKPKENIANKAITKDGGKTWTIVADGLNPNFKSCVKYVPNTNGKEIFAVGKTGVSFSNDGGITWTDVSDKGFYTIDFVDKNTAWLSGYEKIGKLVLQ